ncbi:MAG: UDP-N-acetylglucosamine 2-epimerase (non-hydrolyzing) [Chthonomonadaceae bacterium]|nr:UDP-N-acetylglucosamine 2-epimerase (non-hydrolyzing) [Chthonomonadaceae bacterium]
MAKPKVAIVVGTRPDAIKSAPVALELKKFSSEVESIIVSTGQHREMLDQVFSTFGLKPDFDLKVMAPGQSLASMTSRILTGLDSVLEETQPQIVLAQGDTTTTFCAAMVSFYRHIKFGHIEAGLRTESVASPFPEEYNRRVTALSAALHFPPTSLAAENLLAEKVPLKDIYVTGNTGIDAVQLTARLEGTDPWPNIEGPIVLVTTHRRENWGEPQARIANAILDIAQSIVGAHIIVPMHRNPEVRSVLQTVLGGHQRILLTEPPDYREFVSWLKRATLVLTDSGGIQEEAPSLGVPVLVLRESTERPEGVEAGNARLVGTDRDRIVSETCTLLTDNEMYQRMAEARSPYGDGQASQRIRYVVLQTLGVPSSEVPMWI